MTDGRDGAGEAKRFCAVIKKRITGFQCQLYQGVEYKKYTECMSCRYRNEVTYGRRK